LQSGDQPVDARLRLEVQGVLHLVERRADARGVEALVYEEQQLMLFAGQHAAPAAKVGRDSRAGTKAKLTVRVLVWFSPRVKAQARAARRFSLPSRPSRLYTCAEPQRHQSGGPDARHPGRN